ncbi:MAG: PAS domain S-box protein [Actinobacteria bacterium]|nr:PAS domain S-box protein [Actinomycetota bacterium]
MHEKKRLEDIEDSEEQTLRRRLADLEEERARRARVERALRLSERYFRSIIESTTDLVSIMDAAGTVHYHSPSVADILGYDAEEMLGKSALELVHPGDLERVREAFERLVAEPDTPISLEVRYRRRDGSWRVLDGAGKGMVGEDGERWVLVVCRDVTDRREAEEDLNMHRLHLEELVAERTRELERTNQLLRLEVERRREAEEELQRRERYYRNLIEHSYGVINVVEPDGTLQFVSPSVYDIFGYRPEELVGRNVFDFIHPDDLPAIAAAIAEGLTHEGYATQMRFRWRSRDGSWRICEAAGKNLLQDPAVRGVVMHTRDVTDRVEAERALRESEEKFRLISEQSMMGIMILQDDVLKYVNQAASDIFGYSVEEALSWGPWGFLDIILPEDRGFVREQACRKQHGEEGQVRGYVFRVKTPSGEVKWAELYSKHVVYAGRGAVLISVTDITAHVRLEEELAESEERFRSLIEKAHDVIVVMDGEGKVTFVSPSAERMLGYGTHDMLCMSVFDIVAEEEAAEAREALRFCLENPDMVVSRRLGVMHRDGSRREMEVTATNCLAHPSVRGVIINMRDVTDRVAAHRKLERLNHLFLSLGADLFENMEKIVSCCRDVLDAPLAAYCRLEGAKLSILSSAPGEEGFMVVEEAGKSIAGEMVRRDLRGPWAVEDIVAHPALANDHLVSRHGFRSFLACPVAGKGGAVGALCLFDHRPRAFTHEEEELAGMLARALAVEEERLSYELGLKDFVDVASHELRHPITLMKGYAATLAKFGDSLGEEERREYLGIIDEGANRLDMLIRELLDVSRIERGRFSIHRVRQRLEPILERAVGEMEKKSRGRRFELRLPLYSSPREVDADKILRVLVILLDNAVAHSPAAFPVEVSLEEAGEMGEAAVLSVLDRGVGVPERDRELIFERFYQVEDALHHTTGGMGLGLYIAREIVEAHGGRIWCEPRKGGGTAFRFTLP